MPTESLGAVEARNVARLVGLEIDPNPSKRTRWQLRLAKTWGAGSREEWHFGAPICRGCGDDMDSTPFAREVAGNTVTLPVTVCSDCMEMVREHYDPANANTGSEVSLTPKWDEDCPPRFQEVIAGGTAMPPAVDHTAYERVTGWRPGDGKGLAIVGPEGTGKSLSLWALARELEREGTQPVVMSGVELGRILARAARDIEAVDWLCRARVLMIDDLGKERATPAVGALMWELFEKRYQRRSPLIITTRFSGEAMRDRFSEAFLGDDIRRRLNELCHAVRFQPIVHT